MPGTDAELPDGVVPRYVDATKASIARVYDAALNGMDNYGIDREVLRQVQRVAPEISETAWDNRNFLIRVTRLLAGQAGVRQFLDCGSGLPTAENTHQVAQRIQPDARVVYVDNDPVVLAHGRALLNEDDRTNFSAADIFAPQQVINDQVVRSCLDFAEPIALLQLGTLHHYDGVRSLRSIMAEYVDALPSGSYVAISHFLDPECNPELSQLARRIAEVLGRSPMAGVVVFRSRAEIEAMLPGLELVEPGLVHCANWRPEQPRTTPLDPVQRCLVGAVGRKP
ncbi:MAG: SAM-dependent methyltransferase [Pseudonocardiaceae bacterium]